MTEKLLVIAATVIITTLFICVAATTILSDMRVSEMVKAGHHPLDAACALNTLSDRAGPSVCAIRAIKE